MTQHHSDGSALLGASIALVTGAFPSWLMTTGEKLLFSAATAFIAAISYKAGLFVWAKLTGKCGAANAD